MFFQHKYDCFQFIFLGDKRLNSPYRPLWIRNVNAAIKVISAWEEDKRDWNPKWKAKIENREADVAEWLTMFEKRKIIYYDNLENNMIEGENATKILLDTYKHPLPQVTENSDSKTASDPEEVQNSTDADQKAIEENVNSDDNPASDPGQSQEAISTNRTANKDTAISENNTASDPEQVQNSTDADQKAFEEISNSDDNPASDPGQSQEAISTNNTVKKPAAISESNTASDPEQTQESTSSTHLQKSHSNGSNKGKNEKLPKWHF